MTARLLDAHGVTVHLGGCPILDAVDVHADAGEVVGLIGPNGAGKSTLLRVLAGVLPADTGRVTVAGFDAAVTQPRVLAHHLALVEQQPAAPPGFTTRDFVLIGRHPHLRRFQLEGPDDLRLTDRTIAEVGMGNHADRDVATLSGGERQLVAIARGLVQQPRVLLLDEPTSALDLGHQLRVLDLVRRIATTGIAVVVAVHDLDLAARMCDRLVLLVHGRVTADGSPDAVLTPDLLLPAYQAHTVVHRSPETEAPTVTAVRTAHPSDERPLALLPPHPRPGGDLP